MKLINSYGCSLEGEFTLDEVEKFKKVGWKVAE